MFEAVQSFLKPEGHPQAGVVPGRYYERSGACHGCGDCCKDIYLIHRDEPIKTRENFAALQRENADYRHFTPVTETEDGLLFQCVNLQADNRCATYEDRPSFCRKYPSEQTLLRGGRLSPACGYRFRLLKSFRETLQSLNP